MKHLLVLLFCVALNPAAHSAEIEEFVTRCNAVTAELVTQRDAAQTRAANLAADIASLQMQLKQLQEANAIKK